MDSIFHKIDDSWREILLQESKSDYFQKLWSFVENAYKQDQCYPPQDKIFAAFEECSFQNLKVVLLGQDPYHNEGQAHGLAFSVNNGISIPPSLKNIFKEIQEDIGGTIPESGKLKRWAKQGVLLLNAVLTVKANTPRSHRKKGWEIFTNNIIQKISEHSEGIVFMLWGEEARKKAKLINDNKHLILESGHPSPLSANRGHWFGNKHFSKANQYLFKTNKTPIQW